MYQHHRVIEIALSCFDPAQKLTALLNYVNQLSTQNPEQKTTKSVHVSSSVNN